MKKVFTLSESFLPRLLLHPVGREWARNNFPVLQLIFSSYSSVLQSQNLEIEQLFLRFYSIRTNEYALNPSAKPGSYYAPISGAISDHKMIHEGDCILVGLFGGKDSLLLLHLLLHFQRCAPVRPAVTPETGL